MQRESKKADLTLGWLAPVVLAMIIVAPPVRGATESEQADPNTPKDKTRSSQAVKYRLKKDASGEIVRDEKGNFVFVAEPTETRPTTPVSPPRSVRPVVPPPARPQQSPASRLGLRRHAVDIGPEIYHFKYEEPGLMEEKGMFYGVSFGLTSRDWVPSPTETSGPNGGAMFRAEGRLAFGRVDYDGILASGTPYKASGIDDFAGEVRLLLGRDWLATRTLSTMYAGVGYRYLNDNLATDPAGYERESNYLYIPLGYNLDIGQDVGWSLGFGAEFDIFVFGRQESHFSDFSPALRDIDNHQTSGYGYRASVRLKRKGKGSVFTIEPFLRYWDIDGSHHDEIYDAFVEPENETTEYGIQLIWMF